MKVEMSKEMIKNLCFMYGLPADSASNPEIIQSTLELFLEHEAEETAESIADAAISLGEDPQKAVQEALEEVEFGKPKKLKLAVLNTSILTVPGNYTLQDISIEEARELVRDNELDSAVGHESTARVLTTMLGVEIPANRQLFQHAVGQRALVFKLSGRPSEGKILTEEEINDMGYKFQLLTRIR